MKRLVNSNTAQGEVLRIFVEAHWLLPLAAAATSHVTSELKCPYMELFCLSLPNILILHSALHFIPTCAALKK